MKRIHKNILLISIIFCLFFSFFSSHVFAQISAKKETRVGNPPNVSTPGSFVYYCQHDPKWNHPNYSCGITNSGCGPSSMAMVLTYFGDTMTPIDSDKIFVQKNWRACSSTSGSYMQAAIAALNNGTFDNKKGYTTHQLTLNGKLNLQKAKEYLDQGYLIIGSTSNHIFVVDGVDVTNDTVQKRDPDDGCTTTDGKVIKPNSTPWRGEGWYYAYAIKKVGQTTSTP